MKVIEVVVSPRGEATVQTRGFVGAECQTASRFIEQSLGIKLTEQKMPEFYAPTQIELNKVNA